MVKVRILVQPTGCINGMPWPRAGETIELPAAAVEGMIGAGHVELVVEDKREKRPASSRRVETRKG